MGPRRSALALALAGALTLGAAAPAPPPPDGRVLDQLLAPRGAPDLAGTSYRELTTTLPDPRGGPIRGDVVEVDLTSPGTRVAVDYRFDAVDAPPLRVAVGALPLARAGRPLPGLQATERAPRTAVGLSADGRRLWLVTVDGRQDASIGTTLAELGRLLTDLGAPVAASLDGGGSTTMVRRGRDEDLTVVNSPSADPLRAVTDALAVLPR